MCGRKTNSATQNPTFSCCRRCSKPGRSILTPNSSANSSSRACGTLQPYRPSYSSHIMSPAQTIIHYLSPSAFLVYVRKCSAIKYYFSYLFSLNKRCVCMKQHIHKVVKLTITCYVFTVQLFQHFLETLPWILLQLKIIFYCHSNYSFYLYQIKIKDIQK